MSDPRPGTDGRTRVTPARVVVWAAVGALGAYLVLSGIFGIVAKG